MSIYSANELTAYTSGAFGLRVFVYIRGKTLAGSPTNFGFWNGLGNVTATVTSALDGTSESRDFIGDGALSGSEPIVQSLGLDVRSLDQTLSQIHSSVQDMVRGYDIRHASVEVHIGTLDAATGVLVGNPRPEFLGYVDGAPVTTPAEGQEGSISLHLVSASVDLTRINTAKKGDEYQKLRSSDRYYKWADTAGGIKVVWGQERA